MSDEIVDSVPEKNPSQALLELERFNLDTDTVTPISLFQGPFGAFRLSQASRPEQASPELDKLPLSPGTWLDELDEMGRVEEDCFPNILDAPDAVLNEESQLMELATSAFETIDTFPCRPQLPPELVRSPLCGNGEAWTLLSHYKHKLTPLISPLRHGQETPWMSLVMPCAVSTLGELTMNGTANHARLALLNAILSASAFHLGNIATTCIEYWAMSGDSYLKRAQYHLQQSMEENSIPTPKRSKYKEILMAILSLSNVFVCQTTPTQLFLLSKIRFD